MPGDTGGDLPLWAGKPTMIGWETLQPWLVEQWTWLSHRTEETLRAMYATDRAAVLAFCRKHKVTHILVSMGRYRADFRHQAEWCKPFDRFAKQLLANTRLEDRVLMKVPDAAIIFREGNKRVINVARWETAGP